MNPIPLKNTVQLFKVCSYCNETKELSLINFNKKHDSKDGFHALCRVCRPKHRKILQEKNKEQYKTTRNKYYQNNKERLALSVKNYRKRNPERTNLSSKKSKIKHAEAVKARNKKRSQTQEFKNWCRDYYKKKKENDPNFIIRLRIRNRIRSCIKKVNSKKCAKTEALLGCSFDYARQHIISQFSEGMTWEKLMNSEIELEHRVPCLVFNLADEEEQKKCFHYTNLRPMWKWDNSKKIKEDLALKRFQVSLSRDIDYFLS